LGEKLAVTVVPREGVLLAAKDIQDHVAVRLAKYKVPAEVWIRSDSLPCNPNGKVLKRTLREEMLRHLAG
jgi:acyl-CoA synthetase (AMP-forming)/AMP-acid ligase II